MSFGTRSSREKPDTAVKVLGVRNNSNKISIHKNKEWDEIKAFEEEFNEVSPPN
jgi:hypothetical protein